MALHTNRSQREAHELLTQHGVPHPFAPMANAEAEPGQELLVLSTTPGTVVWLTYHQPLFASTRYTVDVCTSHDDSSGCCDTCGRWVNQNAQQTLLQETGRAADQAYAENVAVQWERNHGDRA